MLPMLATPVDPSAGLPPDGLVWAYEVKWDGMRVLAEIREERLRLISRTGRDVAVAFPELHPMARAHSDVLLDGEVVVLRNGVPSFAALADRMHTSDPRRAAVLAARAPVSLIAFDVLRMYGVDLIERPWQERRSALERLPASGDAWQLSPVFDDAPVLVEATLEQGLEGVVAKRRSSTYQPGVRSPDWLKSAHRVTRSCLVGGWRPEKGSPDRIGALLVGVWDTRGDGTPRLRYLGRVGSGLAGGAAQQSLGRLLRPLRRQDPPFLLGPGGQAPPGTSPVPRIDAAGATWVEPELVVEVRHLGRTDGGRLRQPVFLGVRDDLAPGEIVDG